MASSPASLSIQQNYGEKGIPMSSQDQSQQPKLDAGKLGHAGKAAGKVALMIALYAIGGPLVLFGFATQAEGAARGWLAIGLGFVLCGAATSVAKSLL